MVLTCQMMHAIAGRLRLRVPAMRWHAELAHQLETFLSDQDGITSVRTVPVCGGLVVTYDPARWTYETLEQLVSGLSLAQLETYQPTSLVRAIPPLEPSGLIFPFNVFTQC